MQLVFEFFNFPDDLRIQKMSISRLMRTAVGLILLAAFFFGTSDCSYAFILVSCRLFQRRIEVIISFKVPPDNCKKVDK
jgi:hypothetical protein